MPAESKSVKILVINSGSSSIKYRLYNMPAGEVIAQGIVDRIGEKDAGVSQLANGQELAVTKPVSDHETGLKIVVEMLCLPDKGAISSAAEISACGHRVVHGGESITGSVLINREVESTIEHNFDLAPLHNPPNLAGIRAARNYFGNIPQVACFDTAFHQSIPEEAFLYGLPYELYEKYRIRRYGFHGTSHRYVARRAAELLSRDKYDLNAISCHLGNGCSIAAIENGRSIDTSMGMTPLEGLMMGTRSGDLDPEIILYLIRKGYSEEEISQFLNKKSGLLGISGQSNDVRDLIEKAQAGDQRSELALNIFAYRIRKYIGSYMTVLNRVDAIIFTGGIGENGGPVREKILTELNHLGIILDLNKNNRISDSEREIQAVRSGIKLMIIPTNEEVAIARDTYQIGILNQD